MTAKHEVPRQSLICKTEGATSFRLRPHFFCNEYKKNICSTGSAISHEVETSLERGSTQSGCKGFASLVTFFILALI
jgi:hypothetical protein